MFGSLLQPILHFPFDHTRVDAVAARLDPFTAQFIQQPFAPGFKPLRRPAITFRHPVPEDLKASGEGKAVVTFRSMTCLPRVLHISQRTSMKMSVAAQAALETLPKDAKGKLLVKPEIRSDNGSCYISREFGGVLDEHELSHRRIKPHCPEENGLMERANRTFDEALEGEELTDYLQAVKAIVRMIRGYNEERLHSALGFLRPMDYYRGKPEELYAERRQKLVAARHRGREKNLRLRRPMLPLTSEDAVA